jgi:hypothetical protein
VRSNLRDKLPQSIRRPSLAGDGLPERMRSTAFAFLGLTAAAGLALVAIFAQLGFPLLSPSPLPSGPAEPSSISQAVRVGQSPDGVGLARARGAVAAPSSSGRQEDAGAAERPESGSRVAESADPASGSVPGNAPGSSEPVASVPPAATPDPAPAPTQTTATTVEPTPSPAEPPASPSVGETKQEKSTAVDSKPAKPEAKPAAVKPSKPEAKPAKPKPVKSTKAKPSKPEAAPAPEAAYVPAPAPAPVETGKDKEKEEKDKKDK